MADVRPFRAVRPRKGLEQRIAALPYDVYNRAEAREEVKREPLSFLAIDRAETQFEEDVDIYADCVYEKAAELLARRMKEGSFIREKEDVYYIYELEMDGRIQTGIVACASADDYFNGIIKKHENTRLEKEENRVRHVERCNAQTGPIFLAYRGREEINEIVDCYRKEECLYDFASTDGISHRAWIIDKKEDIRRLREAFSKVESVYIADGHHRCASAARVAYERRHSGSGHTGEEAYDFILSVLFPDDQLRIMDYNRVVKDLNGLAEEELLEKIGESFWIKEERAAYHPEKKGVFGMYLIDIWYRLEAKGTIRPAGEKIVEGLDVSILQDGLLGPILGIGDPRTDARIDFVGGIRGLGELERRCHTDCRVAFSQYPTSIQELFAVADAGLLMPPKSTWFEPKLRSGLFLHSLEQEEE